MSGDEENMGARLGAGGGVGVRGGIRKRSYSFSDGGGGGGGGEGRGGHIKHPPLPPAAKRWKVGRLGGGRGRGGGSGGGALGGSKNVLPSKFLLGGNINDPLNLNSLNDERIARVVNAVTPESSPLPTPKHRKEEYKIEVLIPPNISDPLNLNAEDDSDYEAKLISPVVRKKKVRHRKRPRKSLISVSLAQLPGPRPETEEGVEGDVSETEDEEGAGGGEEESGAEGDEREEEDEDEGEVGEDKTPQVGVPSAKEEIRPGAEGEFAMSSGCEKVAVPAEKVESRRRKEEAEAKKRKEVEAEGRKRKRELEETAAETKKKGKKASSNFKEKNEKFQFGNYNQYYGYRFGILLNKFYRLFFFLLRNPGQIEDGRLQYLKSHWFEEKEVLDIGCNIGHITIR